MTRRAREELGVRISLRTVRIAFALGGALLAVALIFAIGAAARANEPLAVASPPQTAVQQGAAERDVERAYEQATEQVRKVRALNLAITATQADQIAGKAFADLRALRHSAFVSLGQILGMAAAEADAYSTATEGRFDQAPLAKQTAAASPVLLAPRFYSVASRMSELATLIADQATTQLTAPPSQTSAPPTAQPSPSPTVRPSGTPSASPSRP